MIRKISIATCLFFLTIVSSHAVTAKVGLALNHAVYGANGTERNFDQSGTLEKTTKKDGAAFVDTYGSIFIEGAINDIVSMGVEYVPMDVETPQNTNPEPDGDITVSAKFKDVTSIYVNLHTPIVVFFKLGFSQFDIDVTSNNAGTYDDTDTSGTIYGIGYEYELDNGISIRAEVVGAEYDDVSANNGITSSGSSPRNEIDVSSMEGVAGRLAILKSF